MLKDDVTEQEAASCVRGRSDTTPIVSSLVQLQSHPVYTIMQIKRLSAQILDDLVGTSSSQLSPAVSIGWV